MKQQRWVERPEGSNWGDFGHDDELGRLNLITPAVVRDAAREIQEGLTFCLSLPLDLPGSAEGPRKPPKLFATEWAGQPNMNRPMGGRREGPREVLCDDAVTLSLQYSTQWDALCHLGYRFDADGDGEAEWIYYNGWRAERDVFDHDHGGARRLGIEKIAYKGVQTRGVLLDLERYLGKERQRIGYSELAKVIAVSGAEIRQGDVLCLHTGYGRAVVDMAGSPDHAVLDKVGSELDGADPKLRQWITESGIVAIAADNVAVEAACPVAADSRSSAMYPLHEHCLFKLGIPLGEYWWLTELATALAERGRTSFHLTAPPLRLPGAVGSPVTPVGTI